MASRAASDTPDQLSVAYLGPAGTFTEEALRTERDLAGARQVALAAVEDVLAAVAQGTATLGFVPIENSIEGSVNATLDSLVFDYDLLIQKEIVLDVHLHLLGTEPVSLDRISQVYSYPVALAQCRHWLASNLPNAEVVATNSTADAASRLRQAGPEAAAVGSRAAAQLYGLEILAEAIEDHPGNQTRFVLLASSGVPPATGHDRTSIVCFQRSDQPGSLLAILEQFAARSINLTRLESRPTKQGLGQYCFIIDLEGHIEDEVVADCLRNLYAELPAVKFLGSYPAAGQFAEERRRQAAEAWRRADEWVRSLRSQVRASSW
jgi:prephenate dehydratase